jgi:hypothetical protein
MAYSLDAAQLLGTVKSQLAYNAPMRLCPITIACPLLMTHGLQFGCRTTLSVPQIH